jgi:UDP-2,4-diacetamido-2,4,6-trideoxy-beta-L-altropyranose hydrolase
MKRKVFFRADGGAEMGLGHIVRSCALADILKDHFECHFLVRDPTPGLKELILKSCIEVHELPGNVSYDEEARSWARQLSGDEIVVLDGYSFVTTYQQYIKEKGCKLVCIDDIHSYHFVADVIINHAAGIEQSYYSAAPQTAFYLGLKYALIRKEFLDAASGKAQVHGDPDRIFLCLGGADPKNDTLEVLKYLDVLGFKYSVEVIVGAAYRYLDALKAFVAGSTMEIRVHSSLDAQNLLALMQKCSIAVCSPSTISIEYLAVTTGTLFLKKIADNQSAFYKYLVEGHYAFDVSSFDGTLPNVQEKRLLEELDGHQQERLLKIFNNLRYAD